jgi:hypothetical protein
VKAANPGIMLKHNQIRDITTSEPGTLNLEPLIGDVLGCINYKGPKKSLKEMEAAIAKGAREKI